MNVRGDFLKSPHSTNTTALICKSRKENPQKVLLGEAILLYTHLNAISNSYEQ